MSTAAPGDIGMDEYALNGLKGRMGEALVETLLRQRGYKVSRLGRESQLQHMLKTGRSEFLPDFLVWKPEPSLEGPPLHRLLCIEVKYRSNVPDFLRRFGADLLGQIGEDWPGLYVVFVTDRPDPGRSCFQVLAPPRLAPDAPLTTIDLHDSLALGIDKTTVDEYEGLVCQVFSVLGGPAHARHEPRKPGAKLLAIGDGAAVGARAPFRSNADLTS
jgi:hypothetical protein